MHYIQHKSAVRLFCFHERDQNDNECFCDNVHFLFHVIFILRLRTEQSISKCQKCSFKTVDCKTLLTFFFRPTNAYF